MLVWDEIDVLTVLEVEPEVKEDGICYLYTVEKNSITLKLTIYQYDSDIRVELFVNNSSDPTFSMQLFDCPGIKRKCEKSGEYLELAPANCFGISKYDGESSIQYGVRISIIPQIKVTLFG